MFTVRDILYFDPFYFKNGNTPKAKFFIVLKVIENTTVLASLPTSKDHVPGNLTVDDGCVELPGINFNCFIISPNTSVTECGKHFSRNTFLYGHNIDDYDIELMQKLYPLENMNYEVWGKMKQPLFDRLIECFSISKTIKRKYKRLLLK